MFEGLNVSVQFKNSIETALRSHTLSHALIFEGSDAFSRLTASKELAMAILCTEENKPCRVCPSCKKTANGTHPDVHVLKKDEKSNMIKVDPIRDLKKKASVLPNEGSKSIFIIDSAELMNPQAQNALLKIFEEPSAHLLFILCCSTKSSLLDTIISRATVYSLGEEKYDTDDKNAEKANALAQELVFCLAEENEVAFLKKIAPLQKDKELFRLTLKSLKLIIRDCLVLQHGGKEILSTSDTAAKKLSMRLTSKKTLLISAYIDELYETSMMNANHNLTLTRFSALFFSAKNR